MQVITIHVILTNEILFCQVSLWSLNPDQFVEDEDDDTFSYSVRISAQDLLLVGGASVNMFVNKMDVHPWYSSSREPLKYVG